MADALKLGLAIAVALTIVSGLAGVAVLILQERNRQREEAYERASARRQAALAKLRQWPTDEVFAGAIEASLATKWQENQLKARLGVHIAKGHQLRFGQGAELILKLNDADGFELHSESISEDSLVQRLAANEEVTGYEWQGNILMGEATYRRIANWKLLRAGISLVTLPSPISEAAAAKPKPRKATPPPGDQPQKPRERAKWRERENWRRLFRGATPDSVRVILGEPTHVVGGPFTYWIYGGRNQYTNPHVEFYHGVVHGWEEP